MANNNTVKKEKSKNEYGRQGLYRDQYRHHDPCLYCNCISPLYYVLLASVTDPVVGAPVKFSIRKRGTPTDMKPHWKYQPLWTGYANTIKYTVLGKR